MLGRCAQSHAGRACQTVLSLLLSYCRACPRPVSQAPVPRLRAAQGRRRPSPPSSLYSGDTWLGPSSPGEWGSRYAAVLCHGGSPVQGHGSELVQSCCLRARSWPVAMARGRPSGKFLTAMARATGSGPLQEGFLEVHLGAGWKQDEGVHATLAGQPSVGKRLSAWANTPSLFKEKRNMIPEFSKIQVLPGPSRSHPSTQDRLGPCIPARAPILVSSQRWCLQSVKGLGPQAGVLLPCPTL